MANIIDIIAEYGLEQLGRFYSTYRGIVISNKDGDGTNSIHVTIPSIYDGVTTWALPKNQHGGPSCGFKYLTPQPGQVVYIEFEYGDPLRALWSYHGWAVGEKPDELDNDTIGLITPAGNKIVLKEVDGILTVFTNEVIELGTKLTKVISDDIELIDPKVGIPESTEVAKRLNLIEKQLNKVMDAITNAIPIVDQSGAGLQKSMVGLMGIKVTESQVDDIASEHIKQPN